MEGLATDTRDMNKKAQSYVQSETMEYIVLVAVAVAFMLAMNNALGMEKYNSLIAEDIALTINSAFITDGNLDIEYNLGSVDRSISYRDNKVRVYVSDVSREKSADISMSDNAQIKFTDKKDNKILIKKRGNSIEVT